MNENILLLGSIVLWSTLLFILGKNTLLYWKQKRWTRMMVFAGMIGVIVILSGQVILFFAFALGCNIGLPLPCTF